jgi:formylglycine-generating enzyme required for sulfatase activity
MGSTGWTCGTFSTPVLALSTAPGTCASGNVSRWNGTVWSCDSLAAETYSCPAGYTSNHVTYTGYSASSAALEEGWPRPGATNETGNTCIKTLASGQVDEMVKVGDFWIDRFEESGSISGATCGNNSNGAAPGYLSGAAGGSSSAVTASACSVRGVQPVESVTWFQLQQMCVNAGKELCSNAEWQAAVSGTPDPGNGSTIPYGGAASDACNVSATAGRGNNASSNNAPANTLAHVDCVSTYGAYDMIGNLWDGVADWGVDGPTWVTGTTPGGTSGGPPPSPPWASGYGDGKDETFGVPGIEYINGSAGQSNGLPAAVYRGGSFDDGTGAGAFAYYLIGAPSFALENFGGRCCIRGR